MVATPWPCFSNPLHRPRTTRCGNEDFTGRGPLTGRLAANARDISTLIHVHASVDSGASCVPCARNQQSMLTPGPCDASLSLQRSPFSVPVRPLVSRRFSTCRGRQRKPLPLTVHSLLLRTPRIPRRLILQVRQMCRDKIRILSIRSVPQCRTETNSRNTFGLALMPPTAPSPAAFSTTVPLGQTWLVPPSSLSISVLGFRASWSWY